MGESKKTVAVLCHLVWICYPATVKHYNCFKAVEGLERFDSAFHQKANLTAVGWQWWQRDPVGNHWYNMVGFIWYKPKYWGSESLFRGQIKCRGWEKENSNDSNIWVNGGSPDRIKFIQKRDWFPVCREEKVNSIPNILNILNLHDVRRIWKVSSKKNSGLEVDHWFRLKPWKQMRLPLRLCWEKVLNSASIRGTTDEKDQVW